MWCPNSDETVTEGWDERAFAEHAGRRGELPIELINGNQGSAQLHHREWAALCKIPTVDRRTAKDREGRF